MESMEFQLSGEDVPDMEATEAEATPSPMSCHVCPLCAAEVGSFQTEAEVKGSVEEDKVPLDSGRSG